VTTTQTHPLESFTPDRSFAIEYVSRDVNGVRDLDVLAEAHRLRRNVILEGPTGSSKTSFVYAYAAAHNLPLVNVPCNGGVDIKQLIGGWHPARNGGYDFTPGDLVLGAYHGAVILFNEINFLPQKIASFVYGLLDKRRTVYIPDASGSDFPTQFVAHPTTFIVADYNPGYIGTRPLNEALRNRFSIPLVWDYDRKVEEQLVVSKSLLDMADKLRARAAVGDIHTPVATNALMEFEEFAWSKLGLRFAADNFVRRFAADERKIVSEVVGLHMEKIEEELAGSKVDGETQDHPEFAGAF